MSGFSFSHQFQQRWLNAPSTVRQAIKDELQDIISLLHADTQLTEHRFKVADLGIHIDHLYANNASKDIDGKETKNRTGNRSDDDGDFSSTNDGIDNPSTTQVNAQSNIKSNAQTNTHTAAPHHQPVTPTSPRQGQSHSYNHGHATVVHAAASHHLTSKNAQQQDVSNHVTGTQSHESNKNIATNNTAMHAIDRADKDSHTPASSEAASRDNQGSPTAHTESSDQLYEQLAMQIDDFLSDEMMRLSQQLKEWLKQELSQQYINQQQPTSTD